MDEDVAQLEIYLYEHEEENIYVHHDIMLPAAPLCLEWLDFNCEQGKANEKG
jgi:periodic tryptophan protein 1